MPLGTVLEEIEKAFPEKEYSMDILAEKFQGFDKPGMQPGERLSALIKAAVELTTQDAPKWEYIAGRLLCFKLNKDIAAETNSLGVNSFYDKLRFLTDEGLYGDYILAAYSKEEINEAQTFMKPERDTLLNYSGLDLLSKRYLLRTHDQHPIEMVQEMFLGIALHLALPEKRDRMGWVRRFYDMPQALSPAFQLLHRHGARQP